MSHRLIITLLTAMAATALGGENLLDTADLSQWDAKGTPLGYTASLFVPRESGELEPAGDAVAPGSGEDDGSVELQLPAERNLRLDLTKPLELTPGRVYRLEVKIRWEQLNPTGPGLETLGPGFTIYAHGKSSHVMALVKPSETSNGWVTVQTSFDLRKYPDMELTRVFFRSHEIEGRLWLKEAVLEEIDEMPTPATRFLLPEGEIVASPTLAL